MQLRVLTAAVLAFATLATASPAQTPTSPQNRDIEGNLVEALVVNGSPTGGPAWWTVSDGDSKVFILGVPAGLPKGQAWDTARTQFRLKGANALILPPSVRANPIKAVAFFLFNRKAFQSKTPMEDGLSPALRTRFVAARTALGKTPDRYAKWKPGVAGLIIGRDFRDGLHMTFKQPDETISALAGRAHVPERHVASYDVMPMLKNMTTMAPAAHEACLADSLTEIEAGRGRVLAAAQGWARGDVHAALTAERGYDRCIAQVPGMSAYIERGIADTSGAIAAALDKPGKTIAVVPLRQLLAQGGVLDRLRARGLKIETPASAG